MTDARVQPGLLSAASAVHALCAAMVVLSLFWAFQLAPEIGLEVSREQFLAAVLACAVGAALIGAGLESRTTAMRVIWIGAGCVALVLLLAESYAYQRYQQEFPFRTAEMRTIGAVVTIIVMATLLRLTGLMMFIVVSVFLLYALVGHLAPAPLTGIETGIEDLVLYLVFDPNAMLGTPLAVVAGTVILFVMFGKVLVASGCGEFFIEIASACLGRQSGGPAKIAVIASALFGSVSGSAVSNVVTTGVITIPLMRRSGYGAEDSAGIESVASTGGQLMPPIMGAAAFLMATFLEVPYAEVALAALLPALFYFAAAFFQVHLVAKRDFLTSAEESSRTISEILAEGWHFIGAFAVLLGSLFILRLPAEVSAVYGTLAIAIPGLFRSYQGRRLTIRSLLACVSGTGRTVLDLVVIVACAGFIIGVLNLTAGGFAMTMALAELAEGQIALLLVMAALVSIVLGMGMPTTGVYVLLASLVAPALVAAGIEPMAAHLFILYFGMMSMITPPIALAAFAAATIADSDPVRTGFSAMRYGWIAYIAPVVFVGNPALIGIGSTADIVLVSASLAVAVVLVGSALTGFLFRPIGTLQRRTWLAAGVAVVLAGAGAAGREWLVEGQAICIAAGVALVLAELIFACRTGSRRRYYNNLMRKP